MDSDWILQWSKEMRGVHTLCISALLSNMEGSGMKAKLKLKMLIDLLMTVILLLLMAYQVTGERFHEWLGTGMFLLFVIHNILNIRWYGSLLKGRYRFLRVLRTVINLSVFAVMFCLTYSGIVMSRYVFAALPINSGMALARVMHLSGSYWGFVLMSIHLGLHWGMVIGMFRKLRGERKSRAALWAVRLCAVFIAGYGALCFWQADIFSYMFLKVEFAFIDYEKNAAQILLEYTAMMGLWVFIAYYTVKGAEKFSAISKKWKEKSNEER